MAICIEIVLLLIKMAQKTELNSLEHGVSTVNKSINTVVIGENVYVMGENEIINPFFVNADTTTFMKMLNNNNNIYGTFDKVYVLCVSNNYNNFSNHMKNASKEIYKQIISKQVLQDISKMFALVPASKNMMRNNYYKNIGIEVDREYLQLMFPDIQFDANEIVIPLFELTESMAQLNASLYESKRSLEEMHNIMALTSHYNANYYAFVSKQIANYLGQAKEVQFWCKPHNCNISLNSAFTSRTFANKNTVLNRITTKSRVKDGDVVVSKNIMREYPSKLINHISPSTNAHVDISNALKYSGLRTYYINKDTPKLSKQQITDIVCNIPDEFTLYNTFNSFLVSKEYCHAILNNKVIMEDLRVVNMIKKYMPVYKYLFGYAWLCFYIEECIMKTKTTNNSRYVFDIETANRLPVFPMTLDDLTQNPYVTLLINKKYTNPSINCLSMHYVNSWDGYGVCTLAQFKQRFNIFVSGKVDVNPFVGLDWSSFAISGSVMAGCLQKYPILITTLLSYHDHHTEFVDEIIWREYFDKYYGNSDIDLMCSEPTVTGFANKVSDVCNILMNNLHITSNDITIDTIKSTTILVHRKFFEEQKDVIEKYFNGMSIDDIIENINTDVVKDYLYTLYIENKTKYNNWLRNTSKDTNEYVKSYMKFTPNDDVVIHTITYDQPKSNNLNVDGDMNLFVNDFRTCDNMVPEEQNFLVIKLSDNIKFKITAKNMTKTIEMFRTKTRDFFGIVAKFHLPCVRAYYQHDNVFMLPSCITAMMTNINMDYKYFAGAKDPIEIIYKYMSRGYCMLLSNNEKEHMIQYSIDNKSNDGIYNITKTETNINELLGAKFIDNKIFHFGKYHKIPELVYSTKLSDLKDVYKIKYKYTSDTVNIDMFKFKTIDDDGNVMKYQSWVPNYYYEQVNKH